MGTVNEVVTDVNKEFRHEAVYVNGVNGIKDKRGMFQLADNIDVDGLEDALEFLNDPENQKELTIM